MVATFLESTRTDDVEDTEFLADYGRPSCSEVASVAMLAVRLRVGAPGMPPLSVAWGEVVRALQLVALVVLLFHAVMATMGLTLMLWSTGGSRGLPAPEAPVIRWDAWDVVWTLVGLLWVAAYLALVFGHWRVARLCTVFAFVPVVGFAIRDTLAGIPMLAHWTDVLVTALLLLTLAAFHREVPPMPRGPWLVAFAVGVVLIPVLELLFWTVPAGSRWLLDWSGRYCVLIVAVALVHLAGRLLGGRPAPSWTLALAVLSVAAFVVRAVSLWEYAAHDPTIAGSTPMILGIGQTMSVLAVGVVLAALADHGFRRFRTLDPEVSPTLDGDRIAPQESE